MTRIALASAFLLATFLQTALPAAAATSPTSPTSPTWTGYTRTNDNTWLDLATSFGPVSQVTVFGQCQNTPCSGGTSATAYFIHVGASPDVGRDYPGFPMHDSGALEVWPLGGTYSGAVQLRLVSDEPMTVRVTVCAGDVPACGQVPPPPPCGPQPSGVDTCNLKPGDILLETLYPAAGIWTPSGLQTDSFGSALIREASGEYWFHAGVVDSDGTIIDFQGDGAKQAPVGSASFLNSPEQDVVVLRPHDQAKVPAALAWLHARLGQHLPYYNPAEALAEAALRGPQAVLGQDARYYCSLFVWAAYNAAGLDLNYHLPLEHLLGLHLPAWALLPAGPDQLYASAFPDIATLRAPATDIVQDTHPGLYRLISVLHSPAAESLTGASGGLVWTGPRSEPQSLAALVAPGTTPTLNLVGTGTGRYTLTVQTLGPGGPRAALAQARIRPGQKIAYQLTSLSTGLHLLRSHGGIDADDEADRD